MAYTQMGDMAIENFTEASYNHHMLKLSTIIWNLKGGMVAWEQAVLPQKGK